MRHKISTKTNKTQIMITKQRTHSVSEKLTTNKTIIGWYLGTIPQCVDSNKQ
jgi:hypothetical protein